MAELIVTQDVAAPAQDVWDVLTDWSLHREWMLLTHATGENRPGGRIEAFTGVGKVGIYDPMTIRVWEPPQRVVVRHTGRMVRGSASFEVVPLGDRASRVVWSEWLQLPFGVLGRLGWPVARVLARIGLSISLRRLASYVERSPAA